MSKPRPMGRRRRLTFTSLGQVMPDVERLLASHTCVGRWSLAQILYHLALAVRLPMDGVPQKFSWPTRRLFGPVARRLAFAASWMPEGVRVPAAYLPPEGLDAGGEAAGLRAAIERFAVFDGRLDEHPLLGRMSAPQWERFHCLHCAHHLSFTLPADPRGGVAGPPGGAP